MVWGWARGRRVGTIDDASHRISAVSPRGGVAVAMATQGAAGLDELAHHTACATKSVAAHIDTLGTLPPPRLRAAPQVHSQRKPEWGQGGGVEREPLACACWWLARQAACRVDPLCPPCRRRKRARRQPGSAPAGVMQPTAARWHVGAGERCGGGGRGDGCCCSANLAANSPPPREAHFKRQPHAGGTPPPPHMFSFVTVPHLRRPTRGPHSPRARVPAVASAGGGRAR